MTYAPGPWTVYPETSVIVREMGGDSIELARVSHHCVTDADELRATAALISAAPDLYEALGLLVDDEPCNYRHNARDGPKCTVHGQLLLCPHDQARAALAKARGET